MIAGSVDLAGVQPEDAPSEPREIVLDLVAVDGGIIRHHAFEQFLEAPDLPLPLRQVLYRPSDHRVGLDPEQCQEGPARGDDRKVLLQDHERVADGVDDVLGEAPMALGLRPGLPFAGDVVDGEQKEGDVVPGAEHLAGVQEHHPVPNPRKVVRDLERLDRIVPRDDINEQAAQAGDVPLSVAEFEQHPSLGRVRIDGEGTVEGAVGGDDPKIGVEDEEARPDGVDDVLRADHVHEVPLGGIAVLPHDPIPLASP
ncbi:hypothetical protein AEGHOMDF_2237 [Methylobacterium soli]|nr:hypothetical protein AEGHOMDF_2237 [Methylobacterium soli]